MAPVPIPLLVAADLVAAAVIGLQSFQADGQIGPAPNSEGAAFDLSLGQQTPRADVVAAPDTSAAEFASEDERRVFAALRNAFESSPNLTAFTHAMLTRGDFAGRLYAQIAFEHCGLVAVIARDEASRSTAGRSQRATAARNALDNEIERCRDMSMTYPDLRTKLRLLSEPTSTVSARPLVTAAFEHSAAQPAVRAFRTLAPDLAWALATEDPYLSRLAFMRISPYLDELAAAKTEVARSVLLAAFDWVACDRAPSCRKLVLMQLCLAEENACGFERVGQTVVLLGDPAAAKLAAELVPKVRAAVLARDLSMLVGSAPR